jgi:hypothetical protein
MDRKFSGVPAEENCVFGLYRNFASLRSGVDSLKTLRFGDNDISVLLPEAAISKGASPDHVEPRASRQSSFNLIGGTLRRLTYIRPERNGIISAALANLGVPECDGDVYERNLRKGFLLACIRSTTKRVKSVMEALVLTGAEMVMAAPTPVDSAGSGGIDPAEFSVFATFSHTAFVC